MPRALITGGSAGLGRALAAGLADRGWDVLITARDAPRATIVAEELGPRVTALPGDVTDPAHRERLAREVVTGLDLLVNNASTLGAPLRPLRDVGPDTLREVYETNVVAPAALVAALLPLLREGAAVVNVSSDAAVDHDETWGAYASSKAALDHLTMTWAAEQPEVRWWAVDPGDMRTQMHQDAFPGEDIADRPRPEVVVPSLLALLERRPPSGRYRASELAPSLELPA